MENDKLEICKRSECETCELCESCELYKECDEGYWESPYNPLANASLNKLAYFRIRIILLLDNSYKASLPVQSLYARIPGGTELVNPSQLPTLPLGLAKASHI